MQRKTGIQPMLNWKHALIISHFAAFRCGPTAPQLRCCGHPPRRQCTLQWLGNNDMILGCKLHVSSVCKTLVRCRASISPAQSNQLPESLGNPTADEQNKHLATSRISKGVKLHV
jgi:hypothetical protein